MVAIMVILIIVAIPVLTEEIIMFLTEDGNGPATFLRGGTIITLLPVFHGEIIISPQAGILLPVAELTPDLRQLQPIQEELPQVLSIIIRQPLQEEKCRIR